MHPNTRSNWTSVLASFSRDHENYDAAKSLGLRALEGYKKTLDAGDPYTLACASTLVTLLYEDEDLEQAETLCRSLLEKSEKAYGREATQTVLLTRKLVLALSGQAKNADEEATRTWLLEVDE